MFGTSCRRFHTSRFRTIALSAFLFLLAIGFAETGLASETDLSPLAPPDTSSPGATLKSFRESTDAAYRAFYESHDIPFPRGTSAQTRGIRTLDTSQLPPAEAKRLATEAAILLNEALDHVALPAYDEISDVKALRSTAGKGPLVYRIPGTDIAIVEIEKGPKKGEFLFSAETVDRAREFYENSRSMTPRPGTMKGLYRLVSVVPGHMISRAWTEALAELGKGTVSR